MDNQNNAYQTKLTQNQKPMGIWKRFSEAYRLKLLTDQSFRATVLALQVFGFIVVVVTLLVFLIQSATPGLPGFK